MADVSLSVVALRNLVNEQPNGMKNRQSIESSVGIWEWGGRREKWDGKKSNDSICTHVKANIPQ